MQGALNHNSLLEPKLKGLVWKVILTSIKRLKCKLTDITNFTGVQASGLIIDHSLRQCCFVWSEIIGPHSSGNFNHWPLKLKAGSWRIHCPLPESSTIKCIRPQANIQSPTRESSEKQKRTNKKHHLSSKSQFVSTRKHTNRGCGSLEAKRSVYSRKGEKIHDKS